MTTSPEDIPDLFEDSFSDKVQENDSAILEDLFLLGYTKSPVFTVYKDEKTGSEIKVLYRTAVPREIREIAELCGKWDDPVAKMITEQLETLARVIVHVNSMPLLLTKNEIEDFNKKNGKPPSALDQARVCLLEKIKSEYIIDALWDCYQEWTVTIRNQFEEVKKKLKNPPSSS